FGRASVPPPSTGNATPGELPENLRALFLDGHGGGLAELIARRCPPGQKRVRCYTSDAQTVLADTARYGQRLVDYLFRGELKLTLNDGGHRLEVVAAELPLGSGTLTLIGEQPEGRRRILKSVET